MSDLLDIDPETAAKLDMSVIGNPVYKLADGRIWPWDGYCLWCKARAPLNRWKTQMHQKCEKQSKRTRA